MRWISSVSVKPPGNSAPPEKDQAERMQPQSDHETAIAKAIDVKLLEDPATPFEDIIVALNDIGYNGPLSIEWEDIRMDRVHGARESMPGTL